MAINPRLNDALIFLGLELGAFSALDIANNRGIGYLATTSVIASVVFGAFAVWNVIQFFRKK